ncbi:MAG: ACP S-malonyltransferase [Balneolaceae bacterium]
MKAILFPGQGSQKTGMAQDHFNSNDLFRNRVKQADDLLGYSLSEIMFEGPAEKLVQTQYTQPAIFLHSTALFESLNEKPAMVAGHSLGEFSALVAAGVLDFETALSLVSLRGKLMQEAGEIHPGTMAAIIGMEDETVDAICEEATQAIRKPVVPANYNCPGQLVISGDVDAVKKAVDIAKEKGCRLAKMLPVSGAFHSPLMQPAYDAFKEKLDEVQFSAPSCPVYSNYTAVAETDAGKIKSNVLDQLMNPVRWTQTLLNMEQDGASEFIEVGPGKVLQGLVKRTVKNRSIKGYE